MRILLADDHDLVRETIALFLRAEGFADVAVAATLPEAVELVLASGPYDIVLLDWNMPGMEGVQGLRRMKAANATGAVAILSGEGTPKIVKEAMEAGAAGFLPKTMGAQAMLGALRYLSTGEVFLPLTLLREGSRPAVDGLTGRESEVLRGLCEGKSNKEIARDLDLQEVTIKLHVKTLCRKLDAKNRTQAAMIATERGLF